MKVHQLIGLVVAVFGLSLPGMYFWNNGLLEWDASDTLASDDNEDKDNPAVDAYCLKGLMCSSERQYDKAIAAYSEAIKLDPNYSYSYVGRGDAYVAKGDLDRALLDYDQAARLDPQNDAAKDRANLLRAHQKPD
jgi:tetratricopeptide (TPR) repeat protein